MNPISKENYIRWRDDPVTQWYLGNLHGTREELKEEIAEARASDQKTQDQAIGRCQGIRDCIQFALRNPVEEKNEDSD